MKINWAMAISVALGVTLATVVTTPAANYLKSKAGV